MAHIGFTPQSEHSLGGYRVQGRGDAAEQLLEEAWRCRRRARSRSSWRWCPATSPREVTKALRIPTIGIGAGADCDAQVLVWQDMAGLRTGRRRGSSSSYADLHGVMLEAAKAYADEVVNGSFPAAEHSFES